MGGVPIARAALALAFALLACASPPPHPWASPGSEFQLGLPIHDWPLLGAGTVLEVAEPQQGRAAALLAEREWIALEADQVAVLASPGACPPPADARPYLLRGVAYGGVAWYSQVRRDPETGWVVVYHGTYNGENLLFSMGLRHQAPLPVIAYLQSAPTRVFSIAEIGGDMLAGRGLRHRDREKCAS